jgi:hypothetical protein
MSEAAGVEEFPDEADEPDGSSPPPRLEVSGTQVVAGALASVSAAVVASLFGAAGTLIGAAVASVVTTVGSAVYGLWFRHTGDKLRQAQGVLPFTRPSIPRGRIERGRAWLRERRSGVLAGAGLVFVATMAVVTLVEVVGQRPLSGIAEREPSGTTSIGAIVRGDGDGSGSDSDDQSPDSTSTTTPGDGSPSSSTDSSSPSVEAGEPSDAPDSVSTSTSTPEASSTTAAEPPASTDESSPTPGG